jgi:RNA polymerase sigma-70 factor (ECF subfamily)
MQNKPFRRALPAEMANQMSVKQAKTHLPEPELVAALRRHEQAAYAALYDQYAPALFGIIGKIIPDRAEAENIFQDVLVKVWRNIEHFDPEKGRFFTWLATIARRTALDVVRSPKFARAAEIQNIEQAVYVADPEPSPETKALDQIEVSQLVRGLDPKLKRLIDLVYFQGYTQQEASEALELPLGTVKTRIRTALAQLRAQIDN